MSNDPVYECTRCGARPGREMLTVKKVSFLEMGEGARTLRSRVCDWLCPPCVAKDADYNRPKFQPHIALRASHQKGKDSA